MGKLRFSLKLAQPKSGNFHFATTPILMMYELKMKTVEI